MERQKGIPQLSRTDTISCCCTNKTYVIEIENKVYHVLWSLFINNNNRPFPSQTMSTVFNITCPITYTELMYIHFPHYLVFVFQ